MGAAELAQRIVRAADTVRGELSITAYLRVLWATLVLRWASSHPDRLAIPDQARWDGWWLPGHPPTPWTTP